MIEALSIWVAAGLTLAIMSFLYGDNPVYKFAEHLYVGYSAGYWLIYTWHFTIKLMVIQPIAEKQPGAVWLVIPLFFGALMLTRWFPRIAWISRWSIAFTVGIGAGLTLTGAVHGYIIPQVKATILPLWTGNGLTSFNNFVIVVGVITTLIYFFFSKPHTGVLGKTSKVGILFIMVAFGASFGYTVMARISLLIGRLDFLWSSILKLVQFF
ncbi:hypothetical protein J7J69_04150 [candidate division WOR-3 bacterium]|nr:hypothetical protein [candidate division WOR-3 bacterium]